MIHLTIDADGIYDLQTQLTWLQCRICGAVPELATKPEPAKQPEPVAPVEAPKAVEAPAIPETDVRRALNEYRKAHGGTATRELLAKFGADSFPALPADKYAAVMEACNATE